MKPSKTNVVALWNAEPAAEFTFAEMRQALRIAKNQTRGLRKILSDLRTDGVLEHINRRYRLPPKRTEADRSRSAGEIVEGRYSAHQRGFGFIDTDEARISYFVPPRQEKGALDGDRVRAKLFLDQRSGRKTARVDMVLDRWRKQVRGRVQLMRDGELWVIPLNEIVPPLFVGQGHLPKDIGAGSLVDVLITDYPESVEEAPTGRILGMIDGGDSIEGIIENILADKQTGFPFSAAALKESNRLPRSVRINKQRKDLRELPFITIDGSDARDFDDAVCLLDSDGSHTRLLVAVADVAHYVRPGSFLDRDAYQRGTSIYLPHRAIPMLPEAISNDLCSLRPGQLRFTLTCEMELNDSGEVVDYSVYESVIRSRARLTYDQVQQYYEGGVDHPIEDSVVAGMLGRMRNLAALLAAKRRHRGALQLEMPEVRIDFDEQGRPLNTRLAYPTEATRLIEQFMVEANETVARHALSERLPILFRVHEPPPARQSAVLTELLQGFGIPVDEDALHLPGGFNALLERFKSHPQRILLEVALLKSMAQARYRPKNVGHFGLAAEIYTHFTSPIRRYPDLLLHRVLKAHLRGESTQVEKKAVSGPAGTHLSDCERNAEAIEKQVARLFKVVIMEPMLGDVFRATVSNVSDAGLWVELPDYHVSGLLPLQSLPSNRYRYDRTRNLLRGARKPKEIAPGRRMQVQLVRANRHAQELEFGFDRWGWKEDPQARQAK